MVDLLLIGVILGIVGAAVSYIRKAKKSGVKCIGCPSGGCCCGSAGEHGCSGGCHHTEE